jgi:hypothetical protein
MERDVELAKRIEPCFPFYEHKSTLFIPMHPDFAKLIERLHPKFEQLIGMQPCKHRNLPKGIPQQGVYLFSEGEDFLFVGRSNKIRSRYGLPCNPGATHRMAAFAFKLARETTGKMSASYKADEKQREGLDAESRFPRRVPRSQGAHSKHGFSIC